MQKESKNKRTQLDELVEEMLYGDENTFLKEKLRAHEERRKFRGINKAR